MPDYPLSETAADRIQSLRGRKLSEITLEAVLAGEVSMEDLRITPEALELQAQIAAEAGRSQLAENLRRAAELVHVPDAKVLEVYNALRPGRATPAELNELASEMERQYGAANCAALIREAIP